MKMKPCLLLPVYCLAVSCWGSVGSALQKIDTIGREGQGNEEAMTAWQEVVKAGPGALVEVLDAAGQGNAVADNWLRLALNTITDQAKGSGATVPLDPVESFLKDTKKNPLGREMAFDLIQQADAARAKAVESQLLHDPSPVLRRGAVQQLIDQGNRERKAGNENEAAKATFQKALDASRDLDQVKVISAALKELGVEVNLPKHFGFLTKWHVIGPFDNGGRNGFAAVYPPEKGVDLNAVMEGKPTDAGEPRQLKWLPFESTDPYGKVDLNKPLTTLKSVTGYAATTFNSAEERDAELRLGSKNAWKVWLNGELLFGRDEYHRGQQMDQYTMKCRLKKGPNTILVKCCQSEQMETWTVEWEFQLRVCDSTGTAIPNQHE